MTFRIVGSMVIGSMVVLFLFAGSLTPAFARYDYASAIHAVRHDTNKIRHDKRWLYRLYARLAEENREHNRRGIYHVRTQIRQARAVLHRDRYILRLDRRRLYYAER